MASSSRSERELIELINANQHLSADELKDLLNADQPPMTQEEHDQFNNLLKNTVWDVDLDRMAEQINRARAGDNSVILHIFPHASAKSKARAKPKACSKKCSGPATKR